jgi:hypothetical protein
VVAAAEVEPEEDPPQAARAPARVRATAAAASDREAGRDTTSSLDGERKARLT